MLGAQRVGAGKGTGWRWAVEVEGSGRVVDEGGGGQWVGGSSCRVGCLVWIYMVGGSGGGRWEVRMYASRVWKR